MSLPDGVILAHPNELYIGGRWVAPVAGGHIDVISPDTEQVVAVVAEATEPDMDAAVNAAREAFDRGPWPRMEPAERAAIVRRMAGLLRERQGELERAFVAEIGALASFAPFAAMGATGTFDSYANIAEKYDWVKEQASTVPGHKVLVIREPVGVVAAISPWNMPYAIMAQKVAPALVAGCSVIMKPSPETPLDAYIIAEV